MKKLLTLLIVAALAVSMAACSSEGTPSSESGSGSSQSESSLEESSSESSEDASQESGAGGDSQAEVPEENKKLGEILNASRPAEFNEYYPAILSKDDPQAQLIFDLSGLDPEDMSAFAISISPMNVKAYGVAIIRPEEGREDAVKTAVEGFVAQQQKAFEQYLPDQKEIADAATVDVLDDGTVVLVMCEDGASVQKAILEALKA